MHQEFPHHSFLQCEVFAPAAPRRVWIRVSESISGYVSQHPYAPKARGSFTPPTTRYAADPSYLDSQTVPGIVNYPALFSVSEVIPDDRAGYPRVTEQYAESLRLTTRMA